MMDDVPLIEFKGCGVELPDASLLPEPDLSSMLLNMFDVCDPVSDDSGFPVVSLLRFPDRSSPPWSSSSLFCLLPRGDLVYVEGCEDGVNVALFAPGVGRGWIGWPVAVVVGLTVVGCVGLLNVVFATLPVGWFAIEPVPNVRADAGAGVGV